MSDMSRRTTISPTDPAPHAESRCKGHRRTARVGRSLRKGASNGVDNARAERVDRSIDVVIGYVEMRDGAQPSGSQLAECNAGVGGARNPVTVWIGYGNEVRLHFGCIEPDAFGEPAGTRVIAGQTLDVIVECV